MIKFSDSSNLATIKNNNRSLILRILNSMEKVSRAELSRITGLTKTSITNIASELIAEGIICETGTADASTGRRPVMLRLREDAFYAIGIYISRDYVYTNLVNLRGRVICEVFRNFDLSENENSFLSIIYNNVEHVTKHSAVEKSKILGIGVASIGPLDIECGVILNPPNFRGLRSIPIADILKDKFGVDVFLDNDMNASAIAEKLFGKAKKELNFIYVGVTNGVGAGIVLNGEVFRGSSGFAGEIGHTTIDVNGDKCACGNIGCLELYASIPSVVGQVKSSIAMGTESDLLNKDSICWENIVSAALKGDVLCRKAIDRLVYYLSIGLVNAAATFDPRVIILGHDIAKAQELVLEPLYQIVNANILFGNSKKTKIELSEFGEFAPCIGAPAIILDRFFNGKR